MLYIKGQHMKALNILAGNVTMKQLQREVLINTKGQYMKVLNILAGNVTMKQLQREILLNTKSST